MHDTYGLFDYEAKNVSSSNFEIKGMSNIKKDRIYKYNNSLKCSKILKEHFDKGIILFEILYYFNHYWVYRIGDFEETLSSSLWENSRYCQIDNDNKVTVL